MSYLKEKTRREYIISYYYTVGRIKIKCIRRYFIGISSS